MKYITLPQFLSIFQGPNSRTFSQFLENAQVNSAGRLMPLKQYMKARSISSADIRMIYHHITTRTEYLTRFYHKSLFFDSLSIDEKPMPKTHLDNNKLVNYKNVIRNMHLRNILQKTKSGLDILPSFLNVLIDLYLKEIIDYKIITPSALQYIRDGRIGSVFSSFYFRASIMNPYLVYSLNHNVLKGSTIFTPTLGWSSYAYGFAECPLVKEYVGVDVIPDVCSKTAQFMKNYPHIDTSIYCQPSEKLAMNTGFMKKYREHFDVVFFSPPYYELELYPGKQQSTTVYKTYDEWLQGYWMGTLQLCHNVLKKGGMMCYILSSGGGKNKTNILEDMNAMTKSLFTLRTMIPMYNKNVHVTAGRHRDTDEKIMVFYK